MSFLFIDITTEVPKCTVQSCQYGNTYLLAAMTILLVPTLPINIQKKTCRIMTRTIHVTGTK